MKIRFITTLEIDENKYPELSKSEIRNYVKEQLDSIASAMESEGYELGYLADENATREFINRKGD